MTAQPSFHHVEQAILLEMVNPTMGVSLGNWPAPPRSDYYDSHNGSDRESERGSGSRRHCGSGKSNDTSKHNPLQRHHHDTAATTTQQLAVGSGAWTITRMLLDCIGLIRDVDTNESVEERCGVAGSRDGVAKNSKANNGRSRGYSFVDTIRLLLIRSPGSDRRVAFQPEPEVRLGRNADFYAATGTMKEPLLHILLFSG